MSLIPETPEENERVQAWGISVSEGVQRRPVVLTRGVLTDVIEGTDRYGDLIEAMAFLRDGTNRRLDGEFIQAFYAYYFIIEGLYAGGRSSEQEIRKRVRQVANVLNRLRGGGHVLLRRRHATKGGLDSAPADGQLSVQRKPPRAPALDSDAAAPSSLSRQSTKLQPHPFNQQAFEPLADLDAARGDATDQDGAAGDRQNRLTNVGVARRNLQGGSASSVGSIEAPIGALDALNARQVPPAGGDPTRRRRSR